MMHRISRPPCGWGALGTVVRSLRLVPNLSHGQSSNAALTHDGSCAQFCYSLQFHERVSISGQVLERVIYEGFQDRIERDLHQLMQNHFANSCHACQRPALLIVEVFSEAVFEPINTIRAPDSNGVSVQKLQLADALGLHGVGHWILVVGCISQVSSLHLFS